MDSHSRIVPQKQKSLPDIWVGTKINKSKSSSLILPWNTRAPFTTHRFGVRFDNLHLFDATFDFQSCTASPKYTTVVFIKQAESSQLLPSTCPYLYRFYFGKLKAPPILDDLCYPRSWSVDPSTVGTPRTTSVKKKTKKDESPKSPFFLESWSLKMPGFFIFFDEQNFKCEEKNGFLQFNLKHMSTLISCSRSKVRKKCEAWHLGATTAGVALPSVNRPFMGGPLNGCSEVLRIFGGISSS